MKSPIIVYPDPSKPYTVFSDASKHVWTAILAQQYTTVHDGKTVSPQLPINYVSWLFEGSPVSWAALTKEIYTIAMSVKLLFYLVDASITLKTEYLPLKESFRKQPLNTKVNNWVVELSD